MGMHQVVLYSAGHLISTNHLDHHPTHLRHPRMDAHPMPHVMVPIRLTHLTLNALYYLWPMSDHKSWTLLRLHVCNIQQVLVEASAVPT